MVGEGKMDGCTLTTRWFVDASLPFVTSQTVMYFFLSIHFKVEAGLSLDGTEMLIYFIKKSNNITAVLQNENEKIFFASPVWCASPLKTQQRPPAWR